METSKDLQRLKYVWLIQLSQWASRGLWGNNGEKVTQLRMAPPKGSESWSMFTPISERLVLEGYFRGL